MEKLKYDDFLKSIVNNEYHDIDVESDLLENGKKPTFKITFKRGEWITENNSLKYQNKTYYYDFDIDDIIELIINLLYEQEQKITNEISKTIRDLLKRLEKE